MSIEVVIYKAREDGTIDAKIATSIEALDSALKDGWHTSKEAAETAVVGHAHIEDEADSVPESAPEIEPEPDPEPEPEGATEDKPKRTARKKR